MTLFHKIFLQMAAHRGDAILFDDDRFGVYGFQKGFDLSLETAKKLYDIGLRPGDGIVVKATRSASFSTLFYAAQILGLITLPVDSRENIQQALSIDKRMKAIVYQEDENEATRDWTVEMNGEKHVFQISVNPAKVSFPDFEQDENADAVWVFTSGSEGHYKVVRHSQRDLFSHCYRYAGPSSCDENDRGVVLLPLYHVFGLSLIYITIAVGFSLYFPSTLDMDYVIDYINAKQITYLDHVPSYHYAVAKRLQERGVRINSLRNGLTGGAPMEESRFREIEDTLGMKLLPVYGASEIITIAALGQEASQERRRNTVGQILEGTELRIVDDNGTPLKKGEKGEIIVKSPSLMLGYLGEDSGIDQEGFFATGDIGYLDENDDLHITGRKKQIIIRNGNNLSVVEIENKILRIEGVLYCCVVGIHDPAMGEVPAAMVVAKEDADVDEVKEKIENELPKIMWPDIVEFVTALPLLPSGKADRVAIKETLEKLK